MEDDYYEKKYVTDSKKYRVDYQWVEHYPLNYINNNHNNNNINSDAFFEKSHLVAMLIKYMDNGNFSKFIYEI